MTTSAPSTSLLEAVETFFAGADTTIAKDLKLNLKKVLFEGSLDRQDAAFALLASAQAVDLQELADAAAAALQENEVDETLIAEARQSAALGTMLNLYYRFRHFLKDDSDYQRVGLRMNALARPALGAETMEKLVFAVSVINGCEMCVNGHEAKLRDLGVSTNAIHDLARLASLVTAVTKL